MIRQAFVMSINEGCEIEYEHRHNPIWPELEAVLHRAGGKRYSIFLLESTNQLFAYAEFEDEAQWNRIAGTEVCQKWWAYMKEVMPANEDNSPVATPLREVFHLPEAEQK